MSLSQCLTALRFFLKKNIKIILHIQNNIISLKHQNDTAFSVELKIIYIMAKVTQNVETFFSTTNKKAKKTLKIKFVRFGEKNKKGFDELFWITSESKITNDLQTLKALSLEDLKRIVKEAEILIQLADENN